MSKSVGGYQTITLVSVFALTFSAALPANAQDFGLPIDVNPGGIEDSEYDLATDGNGTWLVVWRAWITIGVDSDIHVSRSTNNGVTWSAPTAINDYAASDAARDEYPRLSSDGAGNWVVVWQSRHTLPGSTGTDYDIHVARSSDDGINWSAASALNHTEITDPTVDDLSPSVSTDATGNWVATWTTVHVAVDSQRFIARSTDNGATWSAGSLIFTGHSYDRGGEFGVGANGTMIVTLTTGDSLGGTLQAGKNILVGRSTDGGATWSALQVMNDSAYTGVGNDLSQTVLYTATDTWITIWQSGSYDSAFGGDDEVMLARSIDDGVTWSAGSPVNSDATTDDDYERFPHAATNGSGEIVVVFETGRTFGQEQVGYLERNLGIVRSSDGGVTWGALEFLSIADAIRDGVGTRPLVATDYAGNWTVLWETNDQRQAGFDEILRVAVSGTDTDGDGVLDGNETGTYGTLPANADSDSDSVPDGVEIWAYGSDPLSDDDIDGDGLSNATEAYTTATDPFDADTDNDGFDDGEEIASGTDPFDPSSVPPVNPPTIEQSITLFIDPSSSLSLTIADTVSSDSDTGAYNPDSGIVQATVRTGFDPVHGVVVTDISIDGGTLWFPESTTWVLDIWAPPTLEFEITPRHWLATFPANAYAPSPIAERTASFDPVGLELTVTEGEILHDSSLGFGFVLIESGPPLLFDVAAPASVELMTDLSGFNYDVVLTLPLDGTEGLSIYGTEGTIQGNLVLTGKYAIPAAVPVGSLVGFGAAVTILVTGVRRARGATGRNVDGILPTRR